MSLRDELKEIDGVGDATADKILDVIEPHLSSEEATYHVNVAMDYLEAERTAQAREHIKKALEVLHS